MVDADGVEQYIRAVEASVDAAVSAGVVLPAARAGYLDNARAFAFPG